MNVKNFSDQGELKGNVWFSHDMKLYSEEGALTVIKNVIGKSKAEKCTFGVY
jgi:hypothetical protein